MLFLGTLLVWYNSSKADDATDAAIENMAKKSREGPRGAFSCENIQTDLLIIEKMYLSNMTIPEIGKRAMTARDLSDERKTSIASILTDLQTTLDTGGTLEDWKSHIR